MHKCVYIYIISRYMFISTSPFPRDSESHKADDSRERSARLVKKTAWLMGCSPDNKWLSNFKNHQRCRANMETMTAHSRSISTGSTELCLELQKGDTGWRGWTIIRWSVTGCPIQPCFWWHRDTGGQIDVQSPDVTAGSDPRKKHVW